MKRNIIVSAVLGLLFVAIYSITAIKPNPVKPVTKSKSKHAFTCNAGVTNAAAGNYQNQTVTISWSGVNSPAYYDYGGYYHCCGSMPNIPTTITHSTSVVISDPPANMGGTIVIRAYCSDGTLGGYQTVTF